MLWIKSKRRNIATFLLLILGLSLLASPALADAIEETVVTLGQDLSEEQKELLLDEMGVGNDATIIYVTNQEEHQYLGDYISADKIGSRAISSSRITLTEAGSGVTVQTKNISWVTEEMYANALVTAGVSDADIYVTAPFNVSGTGALTGLIKAFEEAKDIQIDEEQKQTANEEIVITAELGEKIGKEKAAELMRRLKDALGDTKLKTDQDYRDLIERIAKEIGIKLSEEDIQALIHLLKRLKNLNIDWQQVGKQLSKFKQNLDDILDREETRNILRKLIDFLIEIVGQIKNIFA